MPSSVERDIIKFKRDLRNHIFKLYKTKGYTYTLNSISQLIKNSNKKVNIIGQKDWAIQVRGECCELILEVQLWEYIRIHKLPWIVSKSLCLERTDKKRNKTTELDITLFTPSKIILFESKYRKGTVKLIDKCTIVPDWGAITDVYKQNIMHLANLKNHFKDCVITLQSAKPFAITLYVESITRVIDQRSKDDKQLIRLIGQENINSYLDSIRLQPDLIWDMNKVRQVIKNLDALSADNFERHMEGKR